MEHTYSNPFSEFNANVMDSESILNYWCNPFRYLEIGFNEEEIFSDRNTIVFKGGRGSGKTMLFKYASNQTQWKKFELENSTNILKSFLEKGGASFYIRIDGPILRSFEGFDLESEKWNFIFTHYFELVVAKSYIEFIQRLESEKFLNEASLQTKFIPSLSRLLSGEKTQLHSLEDCIDFINGAIHGVTQFRGLIPLSNIDFKPARGFTSQSLSCGIPEVANKDITEFEDRFQFSLLLDEYENFLEGQQIIVNTLLRFTKNKIAYRIGMRFEGFKTTGTISTEDFIMEGRDYREVIFDEYIMKRKGYQEYLLKIAEKRLKGVSHFRESKFTDIKQILGSIENIEEEAKRIVGSNHEKIFKHYKITSKNIRDKIEYKENPLLQLLNCIWLIRGIDVNEIHSSMQEYLNKGKDYQFKKYYNDYINKYKYSLSFVLCRIYGRKKEYYSFNTFSYISSGIVGHFIELCRRSFQHALFADKNMLLMKGKISGELQTLAAREQAQTQLQQIRRIEQFGNKLYVFILSLGNIFSGYHKDDKIKYPEVNQFSVDKTLLKDETKQAFEAALKWTVIQRRPSIQKSSPDSKKADIFTINRIFAPIFGISYRTRGGINSEFTPSQLNKLMIHKEEIKLTRTLYNESENDSANGSQKKLDF